MTNNIKVGIEIENIFNKRLDHLKNVRVGPRRAGIPVKGLRGWKAEEDGSVSGYGLFDNYGRSSEFILTCVGSVPAFKSSLNRFKQFMSNNGQYELNKVLVFNHTTGSHIHVSIENHEYKKLVIPQVLHRARKYFLDRIQKSNIESKALIIDHYFRYYSTQTSKKQIIGIRRAERRSEFNLQSEMEGKGLEWRAINMRGIQTWKEFDEFIDIICDSITYLIKQSIKYKKIVDMRFKIKEEPENTESNIQQINSEENQNV